MSKHRIPRCRHHGRKLRKSILMSCMILAVFANAGQLATAQPPKLDIKRASLNELTDVDKERLTKAITAYELAKKAYARKDHKAASENMELCIAISAEVFGKDYPALAGKYSDYGAMCDAAGQVQRAAALHAEALRINQIDLPHDHPLIAMNKRALGRSLMQSGQLKQGLTMVEEACLAAHKCYGPNSAEYAVFLNDRGYAHTLCKNFRQSQLDYSEALAIKRGLTQKVTPFSMAATLSNLGEVQCNLGEYPAARKRLDEALELLKSDDETTMHLRATVLNNLGYLNRCQHNYKAALDYYHQSLAISQKYLPESHTDIGRCYLNLAVVYWMEQKHEESIDASLKARDIYAKAYGTNHPAYGDVLAKIGEDLYTLERYDQALQLLRQTLKIRSNAYGANSYYAARTKLMIGGCLFKQGQTEQALSMYREALPILKSSLSDNHSELILAYDKIALASLVSDDSRASLEYFEKSQRLVRQNASSVLPGLPGDEQRRYRDFLAYNQSRGLGYAVGMPDRFAKPEHNLARTTATWVVNNKALLNESRAKQIQLQLSGDQAEVKKLQDVRTELSGLALSTPPAGTEQAHQQRLVELLAQEAQYVRQLNSELNMAGNTVWHEIDAIARAIPENSAVVELARVTPLTYDQEGRQTKPQEARYFAWIISHTNSGDVKFVDLGPAEAIDQRITAVRQQIELDGKAMMQREPNSKSVPRVDIGQLTQSLNKQMRELAKLLVDPIRAHVKAGTNLILSPDGNLWLVPWSALPINDRFTYLIEENSLQFVTSSRELLNSSTKSPGKLGSPVVIANPDYGPAQPAAGTAPPTEDRTRSSSVGYFPALPHSEVEAKRIRPSLVKFSGREPQLLHLQEASESQVKQINKPSVLVFSTHGFFMSSSSPSETVEDHISLGSASTARSHGLEVEPHLSCGLALAGCNRKAEPNGEDGVLTGAEVLGLDIRGTELVVLSACDTGVGQVQVGEGVAGLRQSFLLAGARGVVATLWKSLDKESATTVDLFFEQFASGSPAATALRQAHVRRINDLREIYTEAHPYFWASMTYTGR